MIGEDLDETVTSISLGAKEDAMSDFTYITHLGNNIRQNKCEALFLHCSEVKVDMGRDLKKGSYVAICTVLFVTR